MGSNGIKISAAGVEITGSSVKSTATGTHEITGLLVKLIERGDGGSRDTNQEAVCRSAE